MSLARKARQVAVGIVSMAAGFGPLAVSPAHAASVTGIATHYVQSGTGNCSFPHGTAGDLFVAVSPAEYRRGAACGTYLRVTGPRGSVRVEVIDQCPPCAAGHIDLSEAAFARIAPLSRGLVPVTYHTIADPALPGPVSLLVKDGSSRYWLALLVTNTGNGLASVQVRRAGHPWQSLRRASYDYWIAQAGAGPGPFSVRLTDTRGHTITVRGVLLEPGILQSGGTRMY